MLTVNSKMHSRNIVFRHFSPGLIICNHYLIQW